jgi:3-isopropylmalate dehydrogenase
LENTLLYEPIHGSYPQATGLNIANPLAISAAMMFEDAFGLHEEAATIRAAVNKSLEQGIVTEDLPREQPLIKQVILRLASR